VTLSANQNISDAAATTPPQALSPAQIQQIETTLHLQNALYVATATVNQAYQGYWNLLSVGTVQGGTFTLNASAIAIYRPLAAATLGIASPTTPQVQGYANQLYQSFVATFAAYFGTHWQNQTPFQAYNPSFQASAIADVNPDYQAYWTLL